MEGKGEKMTRARSLEKIRRINVQCQDEKNKVCGIMKNLQEEEDEDVKERTRSIKSCEDGKNERKYNKNMGMIWSGMDGK